MVGRRPDGRRVDPAVPESWESPSSWWSRQPWFFGHVMFPHVVAFFLGTLLFVLGLVGVFGQI
ncbi:hypothetical protein [Nocardia sp. NPDC060249]|uniref:hypothetical protein n=1 Tax=Nocardia sp. NPDC060249 TaxID=3347082 RepID=UPI0036557964